MKITSEGTNYGQATLGVEGTAQEIAALKRAIGGLGYFSDGKAGRPLFTDIMVQFTPEPDPDLGERFQKAGPEWGKFNQAGEVTQEPKPMWDASPGQSEAIYVSHLCGYYRTEEKWKLEAAKLTALGFVCMRSPRGDNGRFWEHWYLPGLWAAKGGLAKCKGHEEALRYLCRNVSFGSVEMSRQAAAMTME